MRWQAKSTSDGRTLTVDFLGARKAGDQSLGGRVVIDSIIGTPVPVVRG